MAVSLQQDVPFSYNADNDENWGDNIASGSWEPGCKALILRK